jgi:nucleoside-diphosphate-sugar epimerase
MDKIAIVTGANGWLGKSLSSFLANGHPDNEKIIKSLYKEIRCLVLPSEDTVTLQGFSPKIKIYNGDVTKPNTLKDLYEGNHSFDTYHTAGIIHPKKVYDFFKINVEGAKNIIMTIPERNKGKVVIVSSNSPIGNNPFPEHKFDEASPYNPYMKYGHSKMIMEQECTKLAKNKKTSLTFIRCPWFYGPNQPARQTLFFKMIKEGKMPIVGNGLNRRSMSFIDNLCQGIMLAALQVENKIETYWIADERPYSMNEIIDTVEEVLEKDFQYKVSHKRLHLPWFISEIATLVDWSLQKVGLYHQKFHVLSEMNKTIACSIDKAKKELGYVPAVELKEGMRRSIEWCRNNNQII